MPANPAWARAKAASASATLDHERFGHDTIEAGLHLHLAPSPTARSMAVTGVGISNASFSVRGRGPRPIHSRGHQPRYRPTDR